MNLLRFAGAIVYHFFAAMHVLRARPRVCARNSAFIGIAGAVEGTKPGAALILR